MVTETDVFSLKAKINKLKHQLHGEQIPQEHKDTANRYLNQVIDAVEQTLRV